MPASATDSTDLPTHLPRILGRIKGTAAGPTLLVVAGIHGNEPSGIVAARRLLGELEGRADALQGEFVAVAGNLAALAQDRRFLERDLNRQWTESRVEALRRAPRSSLHSPEDLEQKEMLEAVHGILSDARGRVYVLDLHTTSAEGAPFALPGDGRESFEFTRQFPVTLIMGLQEKLHGLLQQYLSGLGCITMALEGGQHRSPESAERHYAALWVAMAASGLMPAESTPGLEGYREVLEMARGELPRVVEVHHRQAITPEDQFRMEPGYSNLQWISAGALLGHDRRGEIRARKEQVLLMPLYQKLGDDGFFLCREVGPMELQFRSTMERLMPRGRQQGP